MADSLQSATKLAEQIRFAGDTLRHNSDGNTAKTEAIASVFFQNELEITAEVTPALAAHLDQVCDHLRIHRSLISAFVYASSELQAACFAASRSKCVIRISSALVDLLDADEFSFVCGHEMGHFLLGHGVAKTEPRDLSLEYFMQKRAQEVSVDRVGLIACGSLDIAIRALMKTASGLSSEHLRFDVGTFISQLNKLAKPAGRDDYTASHPSILVRCRALLWFSLNDFFTTKSGTFSRDQLAQLDERISNDLKTYVDGPALKQIEESKNDLAMWMVAYEIVQEGVFNKKEQSAVAEMFGADTLKRLINFLKDIPASEVENTVYERVKATREALEGLIPTGFEAELQKITNRISSNLT